MGERGWIVERDSGTIWAVNQSIPCSVRTIQSTLAIEGSGPFPYVTPPPNVAGPGLSPVGNFQGGGIDAVYFPSKRGPRHVKLGPLQIGTNTGKQGQGLWRGGGHESGSRHTYMLGRGG